MRTVTALLVALLVALTGSATATGTTGTPNDVSASRVPSWRTTPCVQEDDSNCYWDATKAGNHHGHSFYSIRVGDQDCLVYWRDRFARHHNHCL